MPTDPTALNFKSTYASYWTPGSDRKTLLLKTISNKFLHFVTMLCLLISCDTRHPEENNIIQTAALLETLSREMDSLRSENETMWNEVSEAIEKAIPADLPAAEKRNIVAVKNADLIQMFQVFDSLDDPLKNQVMDAGKSDQETARKMRDVMIRVDELNKTLIQNLASLEKKDPEAADRLRIKTNREKKNFSNPDKNI